MITAGHVAGTAGRICAGVAAAGGAVAAWSLLVEPHWFALRQATLPVLPPGSSPRRLLHISDLHLVPGQAPKRRWVSRLARLDPDLVVTTGDNIGSARALPDLFECLEPLLERPGAFVFGSNDYYAPVVKNPLGYLSGPSNRGRPRHGALLPVEDLRSGLRRAGWLDLNNATGALSLGGLRVSLAGMDDPHIGRHRWPHPDWAPAGDAEALQLGVVHAPYRAVLDRFARAGADLVLAGHTHGGQVRIPFWGAPATNCDLGRDQARGVMPWGRAVVNVSAGVGCAPMAPVRFACRPEASLLTLVAR
ncbi:metallophosphoesterase [Sediminivirga luteola]|uniref:metallophosphoesterase n=1 Tax=Sediminivirga luteola TaxID=1774748 RepID=UPI001F577685|nr:metallophosphoesterase [Sediminivirga luteola]MCI2266876.1 metallophosphoesterase [Sediminivirga luteola]